MYLSGSAEEMLFMPFRPSFTGLGIVTAIHPDEPTYTWPCVDQGAGPDGRARHVSRSGEHGRAGRSPISAAAFSVSPPARS